jgi:hypothetical protein
MVKYIFASILFILGIGEIVLALHGGLREALMQASPVRSTRAEPPVLLLAGISALITGIGILLYGLLL